MARRGDVPRVIGSLRLTEIRLPLDHGPDELRRAVALRLGADAERLADYTVYRRSVDARSKARILSILTNCK